MSSRVRRSTLLAIAALFLASCGDSGANPTPTGPTSTGPNACGETFSDPECHTIVVGGTTRAYLLHVPATLQANVSALVIGLHGSDGSGLRFVTTSQFNVKADQIGFAVAYPYALVSPGAGITEWNEFFNNSFGGNGPDDSGFIRQLILTTQGSIHSDPRKTFVMGLSNGGFMAHRVGIEDSDLVAAIAVVEGTVVSPGLIQNAPAPRGPVSVLMLHGDQDPTVLYCGQPVVASQEQSFNYWTSASANACASVDTIDPLCDAQRNITSVSEKRASACSGGSEVQFYKLQGGAHLWYLGPMNTAGLSPFNPAFNGATGVTTDDIIWNFFAAHPKR